MVRGDLLLSLAALEILCPIHAHLAGEKAREPQHILTELRGHWIDRLVGDTASSAQAFS